MTLSYRPWWSPYSAVGDCLTIAVRKMLKLPLYVDLPPLTPPKIGGEPIQYRQIFLYWLLASLLF